MSDLEHSREIKRLEYERDKTKREAAHMRRTAVRHAADNAIAQERVREATETIRTLRAYIANLDECDSEHLYAEALRLCDWFLGDRETTVKR